MKSPITLIVAVLLLAGTALPDEIQVPAGANLQAALDGANTLDHLVLGDGEFGGLDFRGKTGITVRAKNAGKATLRGGQVVMSGRNCQIVGVRVSGVRTSWNTGAVLVTGQDNGIIDCEIVDNESLGIDVSGGDRTLILRTKTNRNGNLGINTGAPTGDNWVEGLTIRDCQSVGNNYGMANPVWKAIAGKTVFGTNGLWYRGAGDAAGGVKICNARDIVIDGLLVADNTGAGLWFDVYCGKKTVRRVEARGQKSIPGDPAYFAVGIEVELEKDGQTLIEDCYSGDNAGSEFAIFEASNVTIRNCLAKGDIEFRDLGGGRESYWPRNNVIENVKMTGKVAFPRNNTRVPAQTKLINVQQNLASLPAWTGGTSNPTTTPTPPATESPDGTIVTESGKEVVDSAGNTWMITADRKITRSSVVQVETNSVSSLRYIDKVVYQTAFGMAWKWNGFTWQITSLPPSPPATQPSADLETQIATLKKQLADEKSARAIDADKIASLEQQISLLKSKLAAIHEQSAP